MARLGPRDPAVTSKIMAHVRHKDSQAELALRRAVHARGGRYRLHPRDVYGRPDMVNKRRHVAVFVDGDMWHGNPAEPARRGRRDFADLFPTRTQWWVDKIERNTRRDQLVTAELSRQGYTVIRIWESAIKTQLGEAAERVTAALKGR